MSLTIFDARSNPELMLMQTSWTAQLNPVLNFPPILGVLIKNIVLINGVTVINHKLGRNQQGWIITDQNAAASIYRSAAFNDKTLTLTSSAAVTVNLWVY